MKRYTSFLVALFVLFFPVTAFAQISFSFGNPRPQDAFDVVFRIIDLINNALVPLILALAFIVFIWGVFRYFIYGAANEEDREKGKQLMVYGLIGFFVIISIWGIVNVIVWTFNLDLFGSPAPPQLQGTGGSSGGSSVSIPSDSSWGQLFDWQQGP